MATISLCMIVKNESKVLARCLNSFQELVDEIIIVDTGSSDNTKEIAYRYTNQVYDFEWIDDFSAARNFSFSKATKDYIYVADADEFIDEENQKRFMLVKQALLPEVEIVQMYYTNQLAFNTTYNFDKEYRPKLYKRLREFCWREPIHEAVQLEPVIYDSDIEIIHMPESNHAGRDFAVFLKILKSGNGLSERLIEMYARELFIAGAKQDFIEAYPFFKEFSEMPLSLEKLKIVQCVIVRAARELNDLGAFFKEALKNVALDQPSAEVCFELGEHYVAAGDDKEATIWYYNAAYETSPELNIHYGGDYPREKLAQCYRRLGAMEEAEKYENAAREWKAE
ncbi:MAG: glycosyltransferase family 2 protein [Lachnospiraceae bacterium]|nr:glycosyltransferase family 2 protein [Lachnospiraceae bacterium]